MNTNPTRGPFHFRAPARILWRTLRGMIPHKTDRGAKALDRLKAFEGIPAPYDKMKRKVVPEALRALRLGSQHRYCTLGQLSTEVGWKHGATVASLEEKRKVASKKYYVEKKKLRVTRAKAAIKVKGELKNEAATLAKFGF